MTNDAEDIAENMRIVAALTKASILTPDDYSIRFEGYFDEVVARAASYASRLASGDIGPGQFRDFMQKTLRRAFVDAYRYGMGAAGYRTTLTDIDLQEIRSYLVEDTEYLSNFVSQIRSGHVPIVAEDRGPGMGHFLLKDRAELYAHALRELYWAGYVARDPVGTQFDWVLGIAEHCDPCIEMADGTPYTKEQLNGRVPGPAVCDGLVKCQCSLVRITNPYPANHIP